MSDGKEEKKSNEVLSSESNNERVTSETKAKGGTFQCQKMSLLLQKYSIVLGVIACF